MERTQVTHSSKSNPGILPDPSYLIEFLEVESCVPNYQIIVSQMLDPLQDALLMSGKKFRFELIEIAFKALGGILTDRTKKELLICEQIIESLHFGSMIIDDIQDKSEIRRGRPTFHRRHGIGTALNAGNWLYFQAIQQLQYLELDPQVELTLRRRFNETLLRAHFGQGIDVGVSMGTLAQDQVESTYFTAAELKTGALMTLAYELGAVVAKSQENRNNSLSKLFKKFGIALQIFDDIGNYLAPPPKGKEDLKLGRPSFIWVMASKLAAAPDYERFKTATRMLPDTSFIESWCGLFELIPYSTSFAHEYLRNTKEGFIQTLSTLNVVGQDELSQQVESLFDKLEKAYG